MGAPVAGIMPTEGHNSLQRAEVVYYQTLVVMSFSLDNCCRFDTETGESMSSLKTWMSCLVAISSNMWLEPYLKLDGSG